MSSSKLFSHLLVNFEERIRLTDWLWGNTPRPLILGPNFGKSWSTWPTSHLIMGRPDEDCQDLLQILWASIIIFKLHFLLQHIPRSDLHLEHTSYRRVADNNQNHVGRLREFASTKKVLAQATDYRTRDYATSYSR